MGNNPKFVDNFLAFIHKEGQTVEEMLSPEKARSIILDSVSNLDTQEIDLLCAIGRVAAESIQSDIDVSSFAHSAMDGFALRCDDIACASDDSPVILKVISEVPAGSCFDGHIEEGQCVRIMTGAIVPDEADSVVKYEIVGVEKGDGKTGSLVSFAAPTKYRSNIREAAEEAKAGEVIVSKGEVITSAGVGFLAGCGAMKVKTYDRPKVAIIATGSELVDPWTMPSRGKIRNSNSYAMAACALRAGAEPVIYPIVEDTEEALEQAVLKAVNETDFVVTTGGAANGDFDFIKNVISHLGELLISTVNMRPGKAQAFGLVDETPVFGLPGNPAAAYIGFELLIRPALRKMQGYTNLEPQIVKARITRDMHKRDPRRIYLRSTLYKDAAGQRVVEPAKNQSSGLFGVIQHSNCLTILPEGLEGKEKGDLVDCVVLEVPEEVVL